MNQYILISHIKVQNANAIAGFTWGFPAITHFLGFSHNLARKLSKKEPFEGIALSGCAVIAHHYQVHTYKSSDGFEFTQSQNPPYLNSHAKNTTPPIIEEGKMNMVISLLIQCEGNVGNRENNFIRWLGKICRLQHLAGGTILDIEAIKLFRSDDKTIRGVKRQLLPGFILMDRSQYLENYFFKLKKNNPDIELFDAWLDFISLKKKARPKSDKISKHFEHLAKSDKDNQLIKLWNEHFDTPYQQNTIPEELNKYFESLKKDSHTDKNLLEELEQWKQYADPNEETDANWEYIPKPNTGYLVPIMTGYKAISEVYKNDEVKNTRDSETDVCFVESVHSVGEWLGIHRLKAEDFSNSLWHYHYEKNWYLCKQNQPENP